MGECVLPWSCLVLLLSHFVHAGRIKIQDILACGFLDDLLELRDDDLSKEQQEANWFSAPSALRVYGGRGTQSLPHSHTSAAHPLCVTLTSAVFNLFIL